MWAIIGGSGFEKFDDVTNVAALSEQTPYGMASPGLRRIRIGQTECLFLPRHGSEHQHLPSEVNYRANIFALRRAGATHVLSVSAVGSLRKEYAPGDVVVPTQYIDRTKGLRASTFGGGGMVGHVSLAHPVCAEGARAVAALAPEMDFNIHVGRTYVCIEGPHFSTQAESNTYRQMGADIIGMTNYPEYALAREAGLCYVPTSFVTDYDCWDDAIPHVTVQEVIRVMRENNRKAFRIAQRLVAQPLPQHDACSAGHIANALLTPREALNEAHLACLQSLGGPEAVAESTD